MEKVSFGVIADTMDSEAVEPLKQCTLILSDSRDENRQKLGEGMNHVVRECKSLVDDLKTLERIEQEIMDLLEEERKKKKEKRR